MMIMENNDKLKEFIYKHQKNKKDITKQISFTNDNIALVPWYRRPLDKNEFSTHFSNNGNWYIRHKEWSKHIFIGPYKTIKNCNDIYLQKIKIYKNFHANIIFLTYIHYLWQNNFILYRTIC